jgi:hypothetical protein
MRFSRYDLFFASVIFATVLVLGFGYQTADAGLYDDGLLQLAGATSLLRDGSYPIVQRPPLYSGGLALLAVAQVTVVGETQPLAQELGSILFHDVARDLLSPSFLTSVLVLNLLCWTLTLVIVLAMLRYLDLSWGWQCAALVMMLMPASWRMLGSVSETPLCALLLVMGCAVLVRAMRSYSWLAMLTAGGCFAAASLTRATFQLLPVLVGMFLFAVIWKQVHVRKAFALTLIFVLPYLLLVGGWSARNYAMHGFWGVSGISGVALSTRTAEYFERASAAFPDEVATFRSVRDQLYLDLSNKNDVVYWGARASNWLMEHRGMSYLEANRLLLALNLQAIRAAPLNYVDVAATSVLHFHFPVTDAEWGAVPRLVAALADFGMMGAFTVITLLWASARVLAGRGWFAREWQHSERVLLLLLLVFWYTALVSSAIDIGKPEHRLPVQFVVPLVIIIGGKWLRTVRT